jgi:ubiquinone biosynthesis monooxygenase Coq7
MKQDEARHAETAVAHGGAALPAPVAGLMRAVSKVMTATAYRV